VDECFASGSLSVWFADLTSTTGVKNAFFTSGGLFGARKDVLLSISALNELAGFRLGYELEQPKRSSPLFSKLETKD